MADADDLARTIAALKAGSSVTSAKDALARALADLNTSSSTASAKDALTRALADLSTSSSATSAKDALARALADRTSSSFTPSNDAINRALIALSSSNPPPSSEALTQARSLLAARGAPSDDPLPSKVKPKLTVEEHKTLLEHLYARFQVEHEFVVGQYVRWKAGLRNRRWPDYDEPAIVLNVLPSPIYGTGDDDLNSGSPSFREPLDIVLGVIDQDHELGCFYFDKRRFEPVS